MKKTWTQSGDLVNWIYTWSDAGLAGVSPAQTLSPRKAWLIELFQQLTEIAGDFAKPSGVEVWTVSAGEDAFVDDFKASDSLPRCKDFILNHDDILKVVVYLDLDCVVTGEQGYIQNAVLRQAGSLWINFNIEESSGAESIKLEPVRLRFQLDTDIYAPFTWGEERDNRSLAALNSPKLSGFLRRMETKLKLKLKKIDTTDYKKSVGPYGFIGRSNDE